MNFRPLSSSTSMGQNWNEVNNMVRQLNREQTVKTFKQAGGINAIVEGKLPYEGGYGFLLYDPDGLPSIIIGRDPYGNMVIAAAKEGTSILTAYP